MALPTRIGGSNGKTYRCCGPWQINSAYYALVLESTGEGTGECEQNRDRYWHVNIYRAADPTVGWTVQDDRFQHGFQFVLMNATAVGTTIYARIWCINHHGYYATFDTTTGRWSLIEPSDLGATDQWELPFSEIFVRNPDVLQTRSGQQYWTWWQGWWWPWHYWCYWEWWPYWPAYDKVAVKARVSAKDWDDIAVFHATSSSANIASALSDDGRLRSFYDVADSKLLTRSVDAADAMDTETVVATDGATQGGDQDEDDPFPPLAKAAISYTDASAVKRVLALYHDNRGGPGTISVSAAIALEGATPSWTAGKRVSAGQCDDQYGQLAVDSVDPGRTDYVYSMWMGPAGGDQDADDPSVLKWAYSTDNGATWEAEAIADTQGLGCFAFSSQGSIYWRDDRVVWGYCYQTSNGVFYDEIFIRDAASGLKWL